MSKILIPILIGAALVGAAFLTGGASLVPTLSIGAGSLATASAVVGTTLATTALGSALLVAGAGSILSGLAGALQSTPGVSSSQLSRLTPSLVPAAYRKIAFGSTALAVDTRYIEPSGTDQENFDYIVAVASHKIDGTSKIWFEDRVAWTLAGGVDPYYAGYLTVDIRLEGTAANAITVASGERWSNSCRLTGCAYVHFKIKRKPIGSAKTSPLAGGLPGRVTIVGTGALVYDPRRDSTVGGSGPHRFDDQTTWQFADGATILGENPALQILWYLLGWRINGQLAVGKGIPALRLDLASFIVAANLCDEPVSLVAGGTQRRFETHGVFSENDAPLTVLDTLCTACAGSMVDTTGRLGLEVAHNDLSGALPIFDASDVIADFAYDPCPSLHETINVINGRWTDPSDASLYNLADIPEVRLASPDGIDRPTTVELGMVQNVNRAERLLKQLLQRAQIGGVFTAAFGIRALALRRGQVIRFTFPALNFTSKLFRVQSQTIIQGSGLVSMILREEDPVVYAWDRDESAVVVAQGPVLYDPTNDPRIGVNGAGSFNLVNRANMKLTPNSAVKISGATAGPSSPLVTSTLLLDGQASGVMSGSNPGTATLTTTLPNDLIVVLVGSENTGGSVVAAQVATVSGASITFHRRGWANSGSPSYENLEIWWAIAPTPLSAAVITVTLLFPTDDASIKVFAVNGANLTAPFDPNPSLPQFTTASVTEAASPIFSTSAAATFVFAATECEHPITDYVTGWTGLDAATNFGGSLFSALSTNYIIESAPQTNVTVPNSVHDNRFRVRVVDAIQAATSGGAAPAVYDGSFVSVESFTGGAFCSFTVAASGATGTGGNLTIGLNSDPLADNDIASLDYAIQPGSDGGLYCYESNVRTLIFPTWAIADALSIKYDNANVVYSQNGRVRRTIAAPPGLTFYLDSAFATIGDAVNNIAFGPVGSAGTPGPVGPTGNSGNVAAVGSTTSIVVAAGASVVLTGQIGFNGTGSGSLQAIIVVNGATLTTGAAVSCIAGTSVEATVSGTFTNTGTAAGIITASVNYSGITSGQVDPSKSFVSA